MKKGTRYVECCICEGCNESSKVPTHGGKTFCGRCHKFLKAHLDAGKAFDEAMDLTSQDYVRDLRERSR